jgi:hypothetical protein
MTETNQHLPTQTDDRYIAGDSAVINATITLTDSNDTNLSNASIRFVLARYAGDSPVVEKTLADGITIVDTANGEIAVHIDGADTEGIGERDGGDYYYEIEVTDSTGDVATVTTGTWVIYPNTA